jgi:hypothetical protein
MRAITDDDVTNRHMVMMRGDRLYVGLPIGALTHDDALNLAAWLVAMAMDATIEFQELLTRVENT